MTPAEQGQERCLVCGKDHQLATTPDDPAYHASWEIGAALSACQEELRETRNALADAIIQRDKAGAARDKLAWGRALSSEATKGDAE